MISRIIKVSLVALLLFFAAAPVIVGVYDATNLRTNRSSEAAMGSLVAKSELQGGGEYSYTTDTAGRYGSGYIEQGSTSLSEESEAEEIYTIADWYSGNPGIDNSLRNGDAHLIYEFPDGSVVDFGNPYILDWSDVPIPDDYYDVIASADSSLLSFIAPEKAHAGPLGAALHKLNYLVAKSGFYTKFGNMFYSAFVWLAMSTGMSAPAATNAYNAFIQRVPAITQTITSENAAWTTEGTAMMTMNSIVRVAARKPPVAEFPAALNTEIAANIAAVETTGMLLGGGSGNFVNALYQLAATGGVPASILFSDFGLYIGSWLGGNFDDYFPDTAGITDGVIQQINIGGEVLGSLPRISFADELTGYAPAYWRNTCTLGDSAFWFQHSYTGAMPVFADIDFAIIDGNLTCVTGQLKSVSSLFRYDKTSILNFSLDSDKVYAYLQEHGALYRYSNSVNPVNVKDILLFIYDDKGARTQYELYDGATRTWNTDILVNTTVPSDFQLVGADAQYDGNGNITDYGNVNVPDVTAPDYKAPGSYSEALAAMHAAATPENPAKPDSPAHGTDGTLEDWINANKPTPPAADTESSQDDFEIKDLETVFPFSIPWDLYYLLAIFAAEPVAPSYTWQFNFGLLGTFDFQVDLSAFETVAAVARACETVLFCIGLALATRTLIRG